MKMENFSLSENVEMNIIKHKKIKISVITKMGIENGIVSCVVCGGIKS